MARPLLIAVATLAIAVCGCSSVDRTLSTLETQVGAVSGETLYTATDGLAVHAQPSGASAIIARLPLHEPVTRIGTEQGYAHITAPDSGLQGWVDNARLTAHVPRPGSGAAGPRPAIVSPAARPAAPDAGDSPAETPIADAAPVPDGTAKPPADAALPPPPPPADPPATKARPPSEMLNPF